MSRFVALLDTILFLQDLKPTRFRCCLKLLESFVEEFFYLNPISQLGVISTRNKRAEVISDLSGNPRRHVETLRSLAASSGGGAAGQSSCRGEPSLQNSLEVALQSLRHMPAHASRELLFVAGSLTTCDPGDIEATVQECKKANVRCSVVSLAAEVRIYHHLAKETGGDFGVILDDVHFRDLLQVGNCFSPLPNVQYTGTNILFLGPVRTSPIGGDGGGVPHQDGVPLSLWPLSAVRKRCRARAEGPVRFGNVPLPRGHKDLVVRRRRV